MTDSDSSVNQAETVTEGAAGVTDAEGQSPDAARTAAAGGGSPDAARGSLEDAAADLPRFVPAPPVTTIQVPRSEAHLRRRRIRLLHRVAAVACVLAPGVLGLTIDLIRRTKRIFRFDTAHGAGYAGTTLLVALLWAALLTAASAKQGRQRQIAAGIFAVLFALAFGVQASFFARYNVYASFDAALYSASFPSVLVGTFPLGTGTTLAVVVASAVLAIAWLAFTRVVVRPGRLVRRVAQPLSFALLLTVFVIPASYRAAVQSSSPDLIYFHSLQRYFIERAECVVIPEKPTLVRVQRRFPDPLPTLQARPAAPRNVLFLLQESERWDHVCNEYDPSCDKPGRAVNNLLPRRFAFNEMRSAASSTAVAISNLWTGIDPISSFEEMHKAPLLWDYARAAGYDTAYFTSQNLIFGNARLYVQDAPIAHFAMGTNLDPKCDTLVGYKDESLSDYVIQRWSELKEPFFAVVHYSNLHRPRLVDADDSPYQPSADKHTRKIEGKNHYKNAVYLSEKAVAKLIKHVRSSPSGERTVIVFTADHGEALFEHKNENDHSATVFEEEIRVPAWIDAPQGTLSLSESASLTAKKESYLIQYDLAATVMDLLGVWNLPEIAQHQSRIIGLPLTRPELFDKPRPLTNVSWVWEYHLPNWGMMQGSKKVLARPEDSAYLCFDVDVDPDEESDLGEAACPDLVAAAKARFRILPKEMKTHMRTRQDIWGSWPPLPAP